MVHVQYFLCFQAKHLVSVAGCRYICCYLIWKNPVFIVSELCFFSVWNIRIFQLKHLGFRFSLRFFFLVIVAFSCLSFNIWEVNKDNKQTFWTSVFFFFFWADGHPVMAAGSPIGHIALWDLEEKKLMCQMEDAHSTAIAGMSFVPGEPLLITNGADNAIRVSYNRCCYVFFILMLSSKV